MDRRAFKLIFEPVLPTLEGYIPEQVPGQRPREGWAVHRTRKSNIIRTEYILYLKIGRSSEMDLL